MKASTQFHRGAATPHSHYQALPSNHEHLYANLATSWHSSQGLSRAPGPSALLQRFSQSTPRPFGGHYLDSSGPTDYVNHHPQAQPAWPASYPRPPAGQPWSESLSDESFTARSLPYGHVEGRTPVSQSEASRVCARHDASEEPHVALLNESEQVYRNGDRHEHHLPSELPATPTAPPFPQQSTSSAPVARLLNYPQPSVHISPPHASSQAPVNWPASANSDVPQESPVQQISNTGSSLTDTVLPDHGNMTGSAWNILNSASSNATSPVYELPAGHSEWPPIESQPENSGQVHLPPSSNQAQRALGPSRGTRRASSKRTVARVPAAFVERQEKVKVSKRKGPLDEASRQKTHQMRKDKAICLRCRFYKSGCDSGKPCQKCLKTEGNARSFKLPCTRDRLEDAIIVRHCNGRSNQEEGEFLAYAWTQNNHLEDMWIIWNLPNFGPLSMQPMHVAYCQYYPQRPLLDIASSVWSNTEGEVNVVEQPPYAIYDTASLVPHFERYFECLMPTVEAWIFDQVRSDEIAMLTYTEVMRLRQKSTTGPNNLLDLVVRIQCLSVVSQGYGTVWSNNVPGIQEYDYAKMGRSSYEVYDRNSRDRPLPGAINHQMDVAALKYLKKLERQFVKQLSQLMFKSKIKPWYELFLALYVVFWNMDYIHRGASRYILSKNGTALEDGVSSVVSNQIKKWEFTFNIMIAHWIAILRGYLPFKLARENPDELREKGHVDAEGFDYVMKIAGIFHRMKYEPAPYVGYTPNLSLQSAWIKSLFKEAGAC